MDQKANQLLEEIDLARCRAQWSTCIELSKKYKKLKLEDSVLDITINTEIDLIQLLKSSSSTSSNDIEIRGWDIIHQNDTPENIALSPTLDPKKVSHLLKRLEFVNLDQGADMDEFTKFDHWQTKFTKILVARVYFQSGQYEKALGALQNLALRMEDVQTGYGLVLLIQARAIKGNCLEKQGQDEAAIEAYEAAWKAVELQPQERSVMLSFWIEECLYRGVLLRLRLNHPVKETVDMMRAYIQLVSSYWSPHWRMFRRWVIFQHYTNYLVKICQENTFIPSIKNTTKLPDESAAFEELVTLMNLFRHLFTIITPYLKDPKDQSKYGVALAHIMIKAHDIIGWGETSHIRRVLQYMYQVKNVTFNYPTVSRYMFFTLLRLGSLEEAKYALRAYLDLMGIADFDIGVLLDDNNKATSSGASLIEETVNPEEKDPATDLSRPSTTTTKAHLIYDHLSDCPDESMGTVTDTLLAGVHLYGQEEQNAKLTASLSDLALDLLLLAEEGSPSAQQLEQVYRVRGASYGLLASQSEEHDERARHHRESLNSLAKAVELNDTCWKNHYELGLQQALMRDTHAAILSVTKSIELYPNNVNSWHLLALLYSCKRTDNLPKALKTLEAALQLSSKDVLISANGLPVFSWNNQNEISAHELFAKAESYLSIRMSLLTIKEAMEGPESVLDQYAELFTIYTQLTQQLGISSSSAMSSASDASSDDFTTTAATDNEKRGRRRKSSSISLIRRASFTSIANSITSSVSTGTATTTAKSDTRRRAASVDEETTTNNYRPSSIPPRRAESDTDDFSDDTSSVTTSKRSFSTRRRKQSLPPATSSSTVLHRANSGSNGNSKNSDVDLRKKSLQLIDLGLARRIGTAAASPPQHNNGKQQGSNNSLVTSNTSAGGGGSSAVSLASLLTPSYSMGKLCSNTVSSRSSSAIATPTKAAGTRDGLMVSTFHQHHQVYEMRQKIRWHSLLVTLWLMSTKTFIKVGLLEEACKALSEAEQLGLGDPGVWYQLGQLSLRARDLIQEKAKPTVPDLKAIKEMNQVASDAFEKALTLDPDHIPSQVAKATRFFELRQMELADGVLEQVVQGLGWDSAEAWYQYAKLKATHGELDRAKSCFLYALELNDTEPIRQFNIINRQFV